MKSEWKAIIGNRIKEIRTRSGVTQLKLAESVELSVAYISHIECGKKMASIPYLIRIADELGVTVNEFLYGLQKNDSTIYQTDMDVILEECTDNEKKKIYKMARALVEVLHED